jgi:pimeloyl-ACP methyl ester carboxylesterase
MGTRSARGWLAVATVMFCAACNSGSGSNGAVPTTSTAPTSHAASSAPTTTPRATTAPTASAAASAGSHPGGVTGPLTASCLSDDDRPNVVHLTASGETLEGLTLGSGTVGIVMVHQLDEDLCEWKPYAQHLAKLGYRVLIFTEGADPPAGVVAAATELRHEGATRILLVGASIGGTTVLAAAAIVKPPVAAVVDLSGPASLNGIDAGSVVPHLTMPILFAAGALDTGFVDDTNTMYESAKKSVGRKLLIVDGGSHGVDLVTGDTQTAIEAFLKKYASG